MRTLREHCLYVLSECDWNIAAAARVLEIPRGTLYGWVRKWSVTTGRERSRVGQRGVLSLDSLSRSPVAVEYHRLQTRSHS